ncbi:MAG: hypothetical protein U1D70_16475 [Methylobacter sp.]|nr:hypothetical protein [Methylobacter sp.]MDP2427230.1 hypothetical protein [Methylobacter sp.]MDP3053972.1 hypothetical protein [Methylobacter sp.]MDP3361586.1 hypothetical protein [Methylobacter sp.]MDZ4220600.1 hypothetical protein [Methylobacter sp.]
MFENMRADIRLVQRSTGALRLSDVLYSFWRSYGLRVLAIYRFGRWLGTLKKRPYVWVIAVLLYPVYWLLTCCVRKAYDIHLDQSADIAPGFYIDHFGGIEVRNCRIGPCCHLGQQVKLKPAEVDGKGLVIGENVFIGAHARICADVSVGNGVAIGAGAVVTQDIPPRCLVLGNPSRIAQRDYDNHLLL